MAYHIENVEINGMRKIHHESLDLSSKVYLHGPNGAGKSTVLNAIQLCLMGYIPGQAKSNSSIMSNSNAPVMSISVSLLDENDKNKIQITRSFQKRGNSVQSSLDVEPNTDFAKDILDDLDLPVFDWGEFESLSSNKSKDWFIHRFIDDESDSIDWVGILSNDIKNDVILNKEIVEEYAKRFSAIEGDTLIDCISEANKQLKNDVSYAKAALNEKQSTLNELRFSFDDYDEKSLKEKAKSYELEMQQLSDSIKSAEKRYSEMISLYKKQQDFAANIASLKINILSKEEKDAIEKTLQESEKSLISIKKKIEKYSNAIDEYQASIKEKEKEKANLSAKLESIEKIASSDGVCPYTGFRCDDISNKIDEFKERSKTVIDKMHSIDASVKSMEDEIEKLRDKGKKASSSDVLRTINLCNEKLSKSAAYESKLKKLESDNDNQIIEDSDIIACKKDYERNSATMSELKQKSFEANTHLKNASMMKSIENEKDRIQERLDILNSWVKLTGANGLPSKLSKSAFESLEKRLDEYIAVIFDDGSRSRFNVSERANSFSFGINRNGRYIPYQSLSTGEKAMYAFSLMLLILSESNCKIKTLLIDDILDHLDADRFASLMNIVADKYDVQIILAGVNECDAGSIEIVEVG